MQVNSKTEPRPKPSRDTGIIPPVLSIRTDDFLPLLVKWRELNARVPWTYLLSDALKKELAPLAGKRYAHLVAEEKAPEKEGVAA